MEWNFNVPEANVLGRRMGYERFDDKQDDKNDLFEIAQWFPRMAAYYDATGWQNKQYLGDGEFTLEFGDYDVAADGPGRPHRRLHRASCRTPTTVLTRRPARAPGSRRAPRQAPVVIVTQARSRSGRKRPQPPAPRPGTSRPNNVRDFAFASSRKFIWDAQGIKSGGNA